MNEVPEQTRTIVRKNLYVTPNNKCDVRTRVRHMLLLEAKQDITIARTTYYYSQNKFVCHLEQKSVRTNENNG
jgi:hypothetical protein